MGWQSFVKTLLWLFETRENSVVSCVGPGLYPPAVPLGLGTKHFAPEHAEGRQRAPGTGFCKSWRFVTRGSAHCRRAPWVAASQRSTHSTLAVAGKFWSKAPWKLVPRNSFRPLLVLTLQGGGLSVSKRLRKDRKHRESFDICLWGWKSRPILGCLILWCKDHRGWKA